MKQPATDVRLGIVAAALRLLPFRLRAGFSLPAIALITTATVFVSSNLPAAPETTGVLEGTVVYRGEIPKSSIPDDGGNKRDLLHVDAATRGLQNVIVWIKVDTGSAKQPAATVHEALMPALMDQRDHEFVPRVLGVRSGEAVKFTNSDPANHNVRTSSAQPKNEFNVFTGADGSYTHRFVSDPQQRPVRVGCDIHPWMRGWIYVIDHGHFCVTDARGDFRIPALPAGDYTVAIRQPDIGYSTERKITVKPGETVRLQLELGTKDMKEKNSGAPFRK